MLVHTDHLVSGMKLDKDIELKEGSYLITRKELSGGPLNESVIESIRKFSNKLAPESHKVFIQDDEFSLGRIKEVVNDDLKRIAEGVTSGKDIPNFLADVNLKNKVMRIVEIMISKPDIACSIYDSRYNSIGEDKPLSLLLDHSVRTSLLVIALGLRLNSTIISLMSLGVAALLHDMGILATSAYPDMDKIDSMNSDELEIFIEDHQKLSVAVLQQRQLDLNALQIKEISHIIANHHHPDHNDPSHKNTVLFHFADLVDEMVSPLPHSKRYNLTNDQIDRLGKRYSSRTGLVNTIFGLTKLYRGMGGFSWKIISTLADLFEMNGLLIGDFENKFQEIVGDCPFNCANTNPPIDGNHLPRTIYCGSSMDQDFHCVHIGNSRIEVQGEGGRLKAYTRCATLSSRLHDVLIQEKA